MNMKIVINAKETTQDDIRAFVQMIREWELKTPRTTIAGILFDTDPEITSEVAKEIFEGIFPEFENIVERPSSKGSMLRLGSRGVTVDGDLIGTCDELTLSIGEATEEEIKRLEDAEAIVLVRIRQG